MITAFYGDLQGLIRRLTPSTNPEPGPRPAPAVLAADTSTAPSPIPAPIVTDQGRALPPVAHMDPFSGSGSCGCGGQGAAPRVESGGYVTDAGRGSRAIEAPAQSPQLAPIRSRVDAFTTAGDAFRDTLPVPRAAEIERYQLPGPLPLYGPGQILGIRPPEVRPVRAFTALATDQGRSSLGDALVVPTPPAGDGALAGTQKAVRRRELIPWIGAGALALLIL